MDLSKVWSSLAVPISGDLESDWCRADNNYSAYQALSEALSPGSILEIGTRVGHSLIALSAENPRLRRIRWIDNESYISNSNALARANLEGFFKSCRPAWPYPNVTYTSTYPVVTALAGQVDLCHVDGDHSYEGKIRDLEYCREIDPLWIIADDFDYLPEVRRALVDWSSWFKKPLYRISTFRGLAIIPNFEPLRELSIERLVKAGLDPTPVI